MGGATLTLSAPRRSGPQGTQGYVWDAGYARRDCRVRNGVFELQGTQGGNWRVQPTCWGLQGTQGRTAGYGLGAGDCRVRKAGSAGYGLRVGGYGVRNGRFGPQGTYRVVGMEGYVGWMLDCGVGVVSLARTGTMGSESIRLGRGVGKSRWRPRLCAVAGFRSGSVFFFPLPQGTHPGCRVRFEPQGTQCGSRTAGYARRGRVVGVRQRGSQTAGYAARFPGCRVRTHPLDRRVRRGGLPGAVGVPLLAVSPFLNFPIVKRGKSFRTWTSTRAPRASLCIEPGGYM